MYARTLHETVCNSDSKNETNNELVFTKWKMVAKTSFVKNCQTDPDSLTSKQRNGTKLNQITYISILLQNNAVLQHYDWINYKYITAYITIK